MVKRGFVSSPGRFVKFGPSIELARPRMSSSFDQRLCDILGKCAAFSWHARGRRCNAVRRCSVATPKGRVTKADKCLRLTRMFQYEEGDHLCTTDLLLAEIWARKYHLQKMEWVGGLIMWHFTRSDQQPQSHRQATPSTTTTPPTSPNDAGAAPPPQPPKRTAPLLRIRPPGKCSSVK